VDETVCTLRKAYERTTCSLVVGRAFITHKNIAAIDIAHENGIVMQCFPPHCMHKMQPLGVVFMGPLIDYYYSREVKM
jgi:hypothetical protein